MSTYIQNDKAVVFSDVSFSYPCGNKALQNLSFDIRHGCKLGIIGPNGAGKSTLLSLLNGTRTASGKITIAGISLQKSMLREIKKEVGIVFQNPDDQLFCNTIEDDISFGPLNLGVPKDELPALVEMALKNVGLEGYEKKSSHMLSFGERKLASIATILSMDPSILALDEPTSNLDPFHRRIILNWIKSQNDKTIIITSHDLDLIAETCDETIILDGGKIFIHAASKEILTNQKLLESHNLELPLSLQKAPFK